MTTHQKNKTVAVCDTQPITAEGLRSLLDSCEDLTFVDSTESLAGASEIVRRLTPDILVVDKAFGIQSVLDWITDIKIRNFQVAIVVWGVSVTEAEALRFLQAGARGIVRKTSDFSAILSCIRTVGMGRNWMEECVFKNAARSDRNARSELTAREQQVLELVEQGFKNKDIAAELGIRPGTVKIHLKHIFEKTGVRGRYGLALNGLKDKGVLSLTA
jgi:DNA-binding NarL/FixJ family response regulator